MSGPASVAPGATANFTLRAFYSDGSSQDKSAEASWRSTNTTIIAMSPGGVAVGRDRGEASITATFSGRSSTRSGVMVLPDGTFRVRGSVRDAGIGMNGARVEVTEGAATGLATTTTSSGSYVFYGVAGDVEFTVTKAGYQPIEQRFQVTEHLTRNFDLLLTGPRDTLQGPYTLRVRASDECRQGLTGEAQERTYTATAAQNGPQVTVSLDGTFYKPSPTRPALNVFQGMVEPGVVKFNLSAGYWYFSYFYYYPELIEVLSPTEYFSVSGLALLSRTSTGWSGTLDGEFVTYSSRFARLGACRSTRHTFELVGK